jgi:hypothetical protein
MGAPRFTFCFRHLISIFRVLAEGSFVCYRWHLEIITIAVFHTVFFLSTIRAGTYKLVPISTQSFPSALRSKHVTVRGVLGSQSWGHCFCCV